MSYISLVATISRPEQLGIVVNNLDGLLAVPGYLYEIVIGVDNKKLHADTVQSALMPLLKQYKPRNVTIFNTHNLPPKTMDMDSRRNRIARLRELTKDEIGGSDFVFSFEDDTLLPMFALDTLMKDWPQLDNPGFIEGVQIGRWGNPYVGAWTVDNIQNPEHYESVLPVLDRIEPIDAGGFYCYLTTTQLYKSVSYDWQEPCGPDVAYGLKLRQLGYNNYVDWSVECGHLDKDKVIMPGDQPLISVHIDRIRNRWRNKIIK